MNTRPNFRLSDSSPAALMNVICATPNATTPYRKYSGHIRQASPTHENKSPAKILRLILVLSAKFTCSFVKSARDRIGKHLTTVDHSEGMCSGMKRVKYSPIDAINGSDSKN